MVIVCGSGGVGKGTVCRRVVERDPRVFLSRSWTTRPRRPGELEDAYVFVTREEFERAAAEGRFLEFEGRTMGHMYGTPVPRPGVGKDIVLLEIDVAGAAKVRQKYPDATVVLMMSPSRQEQQRRLRERGDDQVAVDTRLGTAADEETEGRRLADHVIVNDEVERAAGELIELIERRRLAEPA